MRFALVLALLSVLLFCPACVSSDDPAAPEKDAEPEIFEENKEENKEEEKTEESSTEEALAPSVRNEIPDTACSQASALTEHLVQFVMQKEWLEGGVADSPESIFRFLLSLTSYTDTGNENIRVSSSAIFLTIPDHPYNTVMSLSPDERYLALELAEAQKIAFELFGYENWTALSYPSDALTELFDEDSQAYLIPTQTGLLISGFSFQNMRASKDGCFVYVTCEIINSSLYEYEECQYGTYQFTYEYRSSDGESYLRLARVEPVT